MTLSEIVQFITAKTGKTDQQSTAIARQFIQRRYQLIYDSALWRDSLVLVTMAATSGRLTLPFVVERIVSVRWNQYELGPAEPQTLFQIDPTIFERTGTPMAFSEETPVGVAIQPTAEKIDILSTHTEDAQIQIRGELAGVEQQELLQMTGSSVAGVLLWDLIYTLSKDVTAGAVTAAGHTSAATLVNLWPNENERKFSRIRLHEAPQDTTKTLLVLGKRRLRQLTDDRDTPLIRSIDNALIAYGLADIYEHQRQYAKVQAKAQEAQAEMARLMDLEKNQNAGMTRLIPWTDHGGGQWEDWTTDLKGGYW